MSSRVSMLAGLVGLMATTLVEDHARIADRARAELLDYELDRRGKDVEKKAYQEAAAKLRAERAARKLAAWEKRQPKGK